MRFFHTQNYNCFNSGLIHSMILTQLSVRFFFFGVVFIVLISWFEKFAKLLLVFFFWFLSFLIFIEVHQDLFLSF